MAATSDSAAASVPCSTPGVGGSPNAVNQGGGPTPPEVPSETTLGNKTGDGGHTTTQNLEKRRGDDNPEAPPPKKSNDGMETRVDMDSGQGPHSIVGDDVAALIEHEKRLHEKKLQQIRESNQKQLEAIGKEMNSAEESLRKQLQTQAERILEMNTENSRQAERILELNTELSRVQVLAEDLTGRIISDEENNREMHEKIEEIRQSMQKKRDEMAVLVDQKMVKELKSQLDLNLPKELRGRKKENVFLTEAIPADQEERVSSTLDCMSSVRFYRKLKTHDGKTVFTVQACGDASAQVMRQMHVRNYDEEDEKSEPIAKLSTPTAVPEYVDAHKDGNLLSIRHFPPSMTRKEVISSFADFKKRGLITEVDYVKGTGVGYVDCGCASNVKLVASVVHGFMVAGVPLECSKV